MKKKTPGGNRAVIGMFNARIEELTKEVRPLLKMIKENERMRDRARKGLV